VERVYEDGPEKGRKFFFRDFSGGAAMPEGNSKNDRAEGEARPPLQEAQAEEDGILTGAQITRS
jgi:hypothetical protein